MTTSRIQTININTSTHPIAQFYRQGNFSRDTKQTERVILYLAQLEEFRESQLNQGLFNNLESARMLALITHPNSWVFLNLIQSLLQFSHILPQQPGLVDIYKDAITLTSDLALDIMPYPSDLESRYIHMQITGLTANIKSLTRFANLPNNINYNAFAYTSNELIDRFDPNHHIHANKTLTRYIAGISFILIATSLLVGTLVNSPALVLLGLLSMPALGIPSMLAVVICNDETPIQKRAGEFYKKSSRDVFTLFKTPQEAVEIGDDEENVFDLAPPSQFNPT